MNQRMITPMKAEETFPEESAFAAGFVQLLSKLKPPQWKVYTEFYSCKTYIPSVSPLHQAPLPYCRVFHLSDLDSDLGLPADIASQDALLYVALCEQCSDSAPTWRVLFARNVVLTTAGAHGPRSIYGVLAEIVLDENTLLRLEDLFIDLDLAKKVRDTHDLQVRRFSIQKKLHVAS